MAKNKVLQAVVSFAGTIDPSLWKVLDDVSGHLEKVNWKAAAAGAAVGGVAVATGKAVVDAGKYLANLGDDWNTTMNNLSASTGATGAELEALGETVKAVYAQGLGEDFQDVADSMAATQKVTDLTGEALEAATAAGLTLRDTFEYEVGDSANAASALMKNFGISAEEAYGLIATAAQNGADKNGDLLDTLNEYSGQYAALGLSADQFIGSLVEGADAGLFSIDKIGDAVKEFNIRAKDGSDSTADAFKSLGLNAAVLSDAFAAGGETANAAFFDTMEALNKIEDPLEKNAIGVALFGSQFEDLEAGVLPVLSDIETAAYDGADALDQINAVKYNDLGSAMEQIKRTAEVAVLPMASMIANAMTDLGPIIGETFESITPVITETMEACMPFVEEFLGGMGDTLQDVLPMIADLASSLLPILTDLVGTLLPPLLEMVQQVLPPLIQIVQAILPPIASILSTILPMLTQIISGVLPVLTTLIESLLPVITPLLDAALQLVNDAILPLLEPLLSIIEALLPALTSILGVLTSVLQPVLDLLKPIADVLASIVGWISQVVGWASEDLGWVVDLFTGNASAPEGYATGGFTDGVSIVGEDPDYPVEAVISFNPAFRSENLEYWAKAGQMLGASVPEFATGGFTSGLSIAGEDPNYPTEAVISFNPAYRSENLEYWARAGQMLGASTESDYELLSGSAGTSVVYDLSGLSFSPQLIVQGDTDEDALIRKLKELEPEFIDFVLEALNRREAGTYVTADSRLY